MGIDARRGVGGVNPPLSRFFMTPLMLSAKKFISIDVKPPNLAITLDQIGFGTDFTPPPQLVGCTHVWRWGRMFLLRPKIIKIGVRNGVKME